MNAILPSRGVHPSRIVSTTTARKDASTTCSRWIGIVSRHPRLATCTKAPLTSAHHRQWTMLLARSKAHPSSPDPIARSRPTGLGSQRAEAMRVALSLPSDGNKPLRGVGKVPSWLTDANAKALENAPCMRGMALDKACRHCKPTPKPAQPETAPEQANARAAPTTSEDAQQTSDASESA